MCTGEAPGLVKLSRPLRPGACRLCMLGQPALRSTDVVAPTWLTGCHACARAEHLELFVVRTRPSGSQGRPKASSGGDAQPQVLRWVYGRRSGSHFMNQP